MVTFNDIMCARQVFKKFYNQDLPFLTAEKVENFLLDTNNLEKQVVEKQFELLAKYAAKNEKGEIVPDENGYKLDDPENFYKEFNEFLDSDINYGLDEDNYFNKTDLKALRCTPAEVENVRWFTKIRK